MAKKKKKMSQDTQNRLIMVGIGVSIIVCAYCLFSDIGANVSEADIQPPKIVEDLQEGFDQIGKAAGEMGLDMNGSSSDWENAVSEMEQQSSGNSFSDFEKATVVSVINGDTYTLNLNDEEIKAKLIGIDVPAQGSDFVKNRLTEGTTLYAEYDVSAVDENGTRLVYLYFEDGMMVQEWLLNNGYAKAVSDSKNTKYAERFESLAETAAKNKVGLWNSYFAETE